MSDVTVTATHDDMVALHLSIMKAAYGALSDLTTSLDGYQLYIGWRLDLDSDPELRRQQARGATFDWAAAGYGSVRMYDLHAGIVYSAPHIFVGIHALSGHPAEKLLRAQLAGKPDLTMSYSETANEWQFNYSRMIAVNANWPLIRQQLATTLAMLPDVVESIETGDY